MKCQRMEVLLSCYLDGELSASQNDQVARHLLDCSSCAQEYRTLKKNQLTLSSLSRKEVPPQVWGTIQNRLRDGKVTPLRSGPPVWPMVRRMALVAACLAVMFFGIVALGYYSTDTTGDTTTTSNQVSQRNFIDGHAQFIGEDDPMSDKAAWAYVRSHQAIQGALGEESPTP